MNKTISRIVSTGCTLSLAGILVACSGQKEAAPPGTGMPPAEVGVVTLKTEKVTLSRELPGRTSPYLMAEVRPQSPAS